jgi:hypothetical protein
VRILRIFPTFGLTTLAAVCGRPGHADDTPKLLLSLERPAIGDRRPGDELGRLDSFTVEAWIEADFYRAEALQALVSRWPIPEKFGRFEAYDASHTGGLNVQGFFGCVFDGRYVYFVPQHDGAGRHGKALRYDTHAGFKEPGSWAAYDAGKTSGLNTKGYYGAVHDGRYVYFVPRTDGETSHTRLLRYDPRGEFTEPASWRAHDVGLKTSYQSAAFDGRFIYFCPGYNDPPGEKCSSTMLRYDTQGDFDDPKSYATYNAAKTGGLNTACYDGAVFDGRYVYLAPLDLQGQMLRLDTRRQFTDRESWQSFDATEVGGLKMGKCVGAVFDGRFVYYAPYAHSLALRFDTAGEFRDRRSWSAFSAENVSGFKTKGYDGALFDGRFVYYVPFWEGEDLKHGNHGRLLRYDATRDFADAASWSAADASQTDGLRAVGFNGAAFDGRFIYFAPWRAGTDDKGGIVPSGNVLRYDTTGPDAIFSLRAVDLGHNGGLCAAVPGPTFLVNTDRGVLSVRANRTLESGTRHLAGVYDGRSARLYIDGKLAGEQSGTGRVLGGQSDLVIGRLQDALAAFQGTIRKVRLWAGPLSPEQISASKP